MQVINYLLKQKSLPAEKFKDMKTSELNDLQKTELETKLEDNLDALQNLRFQKALQQLADPQQIRYLRREIAQLKTVLQEYKLGIRKDLAEGK